ncbi:MAG: hypothetical protein AVDCRST_MAG88-4310, partial [uncultured Thermomicrobiales bacterium]
VRPPAGALCRLARPHGRCPLAGRRRPLDRRAGLVPRAGPAAARPRAPPVAGGAAARGPGVPAPAGLRRDTATSPRPVPGGAGPGRHDLQRRQRSGRARPPRRDPRRLGGRCDRPAGVDGPASGRARPHASRDLPAPGALPGRYPGHRPAEPLSHPRGVANAPLPGPAGPAGRARGRRPGADGARGPPAAAAPAPGRPLHGRTDGAAGRRADRARRRRRPGAPDRRPQPDPAARQLRRFATRRAARRLRRGRARIWIYPATALGGAPAAPLHPGRLRLAHRRSCGIARVGRRRRGVGPSARPRAATLAL